MASTKVLEQPRPVIVMMSNREVLRVLLAGALVGLVTYGLYLLLDRYALEAALCSEETGVLSRCEAKSAYASSIAMISGAVFALIAMVRMRVYRPLLVVIGVCASLWGVLLLAVEVHWLVLTLAISLLFGIAYAAFMWLVRVRRFYIAVFLAIMLVIMVRLIISS